MWPRGPHKKHIYCPRATFLCKSDKKQAIWVYLLILRVAGGRTDHVGGPHAARKKMPVWDPCLRVCLGFSENNFFSSRKKILLNFHKKHFISLSELLFFKSLESILCRNVSLKKTKLALNSFTVHYLNLDHNIIVA